MTSASTTFLFDPQRTGRSKYGLGCLNPPQLLWRFALRSFPAFAPESTSVFDEFGNQYFGAHDACFYSLDAEGLYRWSFRAPYKIYSSPCLGCRGEVFFLSGDGTLFCLSRDTGELRWTQSLPFPLINRFLRRFVHFRNFLAYDYYRHVRQSMRAWASPNVSADGSVVYSVGRGLGLQAVETNSGKRRWVYDLGQPWNHLAGVSLGPDGVIYAISQRRYLHAVSPEGERVWRFDCGLPLDLWGSPSVDVERGCVYFTGARGRDIGYSFAVDLSGNERWRQKLPGGTRGGLAISHADWGGIACLSGEVVFLERDTGRIRSAVKIVDAPGRLTLWTTPSITPQGDALVATVDGDTSGSVCCFDESHRLRWRLPLGKSHATPVVDEQHRLYAGSWTGEMVCYQT